MIRLNFGVVILSAAALFSAVPPGRASAQDNPRQQNPKEQSAPRETGVAVRAERGTPAPAPPNAGGGGNAGAAEPRGGGMAPPPSASSGGGGNGGAPPGSGGSRPYGGPGGFDSPADARSDKAPTRTASPWFLRPRGSSPATGPSNVRPAPTGGDRGQGPGGTGGRGPNGARGQGPGGARGGGPQPGQHYGSYRGYRGPYGSYGSYGWGIFGLGYLNFYDPFWWSYGEYPGYWAYPGYDYGYAYDDQGWYDLSTGGAYVQPQGVWGSIRLKVKPAHATVHVDGYYAGRVDDFDGMFQKLRLEQGPHRIEISAPGLKALSFEVNIRGGDDISFQGQLEPIR